MAYTPINWDEITPITPTNLNKMDNQIDENEDDLRTIQGGKTEVDGRITKNESDINTINSGYLANVDYGTTEDLIFAPDKAIGSYNLYDTINGYTDGKGFVLVIANDITFDVDGRQIVDPVGLFFASPQKLIDFGTSTNPEMTFYKIE